MATDEQLKRVLADRGIEKVLVKAGLPDTLPEGWQILRLQDENGNFVVEYQKEGDLFPVSFVAENLQDAESMMLDYLTEHGA